MSELPAKQEKRSKAQLFAGACLILFAILMLSMVIKDKSYNDLLLPLALGILGGGLLTDYFRGDTAAREFMEKTISKIFRRRF